MVGVGKSIVAVQESADDIGAFLSAFAALLLDDVLRLDEISGCVTETAPGAGRPDRELIVSLQAFDRLKQEFEALGDALAKYAELTNTCPSLAKSAPASVGM